MDDTLVLIDTAIPCGLILNELISNSLKYAFKPTGEGEIRINLRRDAGGEIELVYSDNGVGVPPGFDFRRDGHLGVQNIFILGENQLRGKVFFTAGQGVECRLTFQDIFYEPRI
ncbi:MAG: sensor histidine kinase [Holophaga sp.]|nr:sensor histidine kinase [Holophaga sp.]